MRMAYRLVDADKGDVRLPDSTEVVEPKYPAGMLQPRKRGGRGVCS